MLEKMIQQVQQAQTISYTGKIENIVGMSIEASGGRADAAVPGGVFAAVGAAGAGDVGPGGPLLKICSGAAGGSPAALPFYPSLQNFAVFFSFLPKMWNLPKF